MSLWWVKCTSVLYHSLSCKLHLLPLDTHTLPRLFQPNSSYSCANSLLYHYLSCLYHTFWNNLLLPCLFWRAAEGCLRAMLLALSCGSSITLVAPELYPPSVEQAAWWPQTGCSASAHTSVLSGELSLPNLGHLVDSIWGISLTWDLRRSKWMRWRERGWMT